MLSIPRKKIVYAFLVITWVVITAWQVLEHNRVRASARDALVNRSQDVAATLSVVIRSQGRFGFIHQPRLEAAIEELADLTELQSVVLLNAAGEVTARGGEEMSLDTVGLLETQEHWEDGLATFVHVVALGPGTEQAPVIVPRPEGDPKRPDGPRKDSPWGGMLSERAVETIRGLMTEEPLDEAQVEQVLQLMPAEAVTEENAETIRQTLLSHPLNRETLQDVSALLHGRRRSPGGGGGPGGGRGGGHGGGPGGERGSGRFGPRPGPERPPWLNQADYESLLKERGVHWFLVTMPTDAVQAETMRDLELRSIVALVSFLACLALALAWRIFERSTELRVGLVRAKEMNEHLRELNLAAAGLAHETKNPLNVIRGLAQTIGRQAESGSPVGETAVRITEESDRVTGRLNQFLDYSRPPEPAPLPTDLAGLARDIFELLESDREDKDVHFTLTGPECTVLADEGLLRQVVFNLLLNAVQAVEQGGLIEVRLLAQSNRGMTFEVRDDGPGVAEEARDDMFRPYYTGSQQGTGLGLTIVRQIVMAHGWKIAYESPASGGAVFRVSGLDTA